MMQRNRSRAAALLLMAALAACSDAPTGVATTAAEPAAAPRFNTAPTVTVTDSGGTPLISWGALAGATSYSVVQKSQFITMMNGRPSRSVGSRSVGSTSGTSLLDTANIYTGNSFCSWDFGDGHTESESHSYVVTATFASGTSTTTVDAPVAGC